MDHVPLKKAAYPWYMHRNAEQGRAPQKENILYMKARKAFHTGQEHTR